MLRRLPKNSEADEGFRPAYLALSRREFSEKVSIALESLKRCNLCPRNCAVDRTKGQIGFCKTLDQPVVASYGPHFGEERPLVGPVSGFLTRRGGSGTIFFGNCNLGCVFCQNWTISRMGEVPHVQYENEDEPFEKLASIMLELQDMGCHNINLVTPTHQMPMILKALWIAAQKGLSLPIVYNCGGYESIDALRILDGVIDIYMPDFKYWDEKTAEKYSLVKNYPEVARAAIKEMHRQVGDLIIEHGIARRGLLVRHLVLPGGLSGTEHVVRFIAEEISKDTYINIMDQYYPCYKAYKYPPLDRKITSAEYEAAIEAAKKAGLRRLSGITVD